MQNNKDLVIFTYDFPFGKSEKTFIQYEISCLLKDFKNIEIINQKNFQENSLLSNDKKNLYFNKKFSKFVNLKNIFLIFFKKVAFKAFFWQEIFYIIFKKNFFKKFRMCFSEICLAYLLYEFIKKEKNPQNEMIFYSFWSNFPLISFIELKKDFKNSKFLSRGLGSDLNGYIKNDDYVPFKKVKFLALNKLVLLGDYQKDGLKNLNLENKIEISPIGVYSQKKEVQNIKFNFDEPITFVSCGNLIEIKNNLLMIDFLNKFNYQTKIKIKYIMIGKGVLKNKICNEIKKYSQIEFIHYEQIENFVDFINQNKIHFLLNFSSQEGMPFTIMESMSCGLPAIVSNIKPNEYLVKGNGFVFDLDNYENSINEMIFEIKETLKDKEKYMVKSKNSFNFINENLINSECYRKFKIILDNL